MAAYWGRSHGRHGLAALVAIAALSAVTSGCEDYAIEGSYKPPFVPISVSINEEGELSVRYDASIVTPIGTFSLNITPPVDLGEGDSLLELLHTRGSEPVRSVFRLHDFGKAGTNIMVTGGTGVEKSGDEDTTTIEIPPGAQDFTLEADDSEAVAEPTATSVTTWSEPEPTTTSPSTESSTSSSEPPSGTETPPDSVPATLPPVEVTSSGG